MVTARAIALKALDVALAYAAAGVYEVGGNNRGDQIEHFQALMGGHPGDAWCADFVSMCEVKAYAFLHGLPSDMDSLKKYLPDVAHVLLPLSGYVPTLWANAKARNVARDRHGPCTAGDLIFYDFLRQGEPHHVGIVRSMLTDGNIATVEGNTSSGMEGSQRDGDGVYKRIRPRDFVWGFAHFG